MVTQISINDILTKAQIKEYTNTTYGLKAKGIHPGSTEFVQGLKKLFGQWRDELSNKGIDSDYLAYLIDYLLSKGNNHE